MSGLDLCKAGKRGAEGGPRIAVMARNVRVRDASPAVQTRRLDNVRMMMMVVVTTTVRYVYPCLRLVLGKLALFDLQ